MSVMQVKVNTMNSKSSNKVASIPLALVAFVFFAASMLLHAPDADARPRPASSSKMSDFQANKTFGLGIMLGAPSGLSGKYYLSADTALDFGLGTIYGYRDRRGFHIHGDFLWHPFSLASADAFELPFYFGIGARLLNGSRCYDYDRGRCDYYYRDYSALGVRAPVGLSFDFNNIPLDIFVELALVVDFLLDHDERYDDALYLDINGAFGIRYYFN